MPIPGEKEFTIHDAEGNANPLALLSHDHFWILGAINLIIIALVLISCSLRSDYFHGSYFITRAKEWVHLPTLNPGDPQEQLIPIEGSYASHEEEYRDVEGNQKQQTLQQVGQDSCKWISETTSSNLKLSDLISANTNSSNQQTLEQELSTLCLSESSSLPLSPSFKEASRASFKASRDQFVFNSDIFLTKSESLDEARSRADLRDSKCFKTNRSVDEILTKSEHSSLPASSEQRPAASSIPCTPKCRKLQERRGSNHSLTIAVKPTETNVLPTVVTPRECSAAQFLLTAGNCMSRRQLRSCLKDVKSLHAEFWSIPTNAPELVDLVAGCAIKNRYRYVLPNPHSRVKLPVSNPADPTSGYINGNYIRAHNGDARAYIATQGPLTNTINDFWLMVWAERSPAIVMITKLVESGKTKCDPYLPKDGETTCRYGDISIFVDSTEESEGCTIRSLTLKHDCESSVHRVTHYWYSDWPDHKTPENPKSLVDLAVTIESLRRGQASLSSTAPSPNFEIGPIIVHCSAGIGRTGCFLALCQGISQIVTEEKVDVLGIVCALRCDRRDGTNSRTIRVHPSWPLPLRTHHIIANVRGLESITVYGSPLYDLHRLLS